MTVAALPDTGASVQVLDNGDEIHTLPEGRLLYRDSNHSYWVHPLDRVTGEHPRLLGVSTGAKTLDYDSRNLVAAAACVQCLGLGGLLREEPQWAEWLEEEFRVFLAGRPSGASWADWRKAPDGIWEALLKRQLTYQDVWDRAADLGTNIHLDVFEALALGRDLPDLSTVSFDERMKAEGVIAFWKAEKPESILVEQVVYSKRLRVAGRLDFYGRIASREGIGIVDLKTGSFLSATAHAQVGGGYPLCVEESGWEAPAWSAMLQVADGGYTLVEAEAGPAEFECAVNAYRAAGRINGAATKARKARAAA